MFYAHEFQSLFRFYSNVLNQISAWENNEWAIKKRWVWMMRNFTNGPFNVRWLIAPTKTKQCKTKKMKKKQGKSAKHMQNLEYTLCKSLFKLIRFFLVNIQQKFYNSLFVCLFMFRLFLLFFLLLLILFGFECELHVYCVQLPTIIFISKIPLHCSVPVYV